MKVLSLVDRETGQARSVVVDDLKPATVVPILEENIAKEARVMTDEAGHYHHLRDTFAEHKVVRHGQEEYVSLEDPTIHTNTIEGYFSIFKRGMKGVYQHCGKQHLHRYLAELMAHVSQLRALSKSSLPHRSGLGSACRTSPKRQIRPSALPAVTASER
jgi:transposase-like protein